MKSGRYQFTRMLVLVLALSALIPAAASARLDLNPVVAPSQSSPAPAAQVVTTSAGGSFAWGDAGIGAVAGLGLSIVAFGLTRLRSNPLSSAGGERG